MKRSLLIGCLFSIVGCGAIGASSPADPAPLTGSVQVIHIGATWCSECTFELSSLERIKQQLGRVEVTVLLLDTSKDSVHGFKQRQPTSLPLLFDQTGTFQRMFNVTSVPKSLVYGCDGALRAVLDGKMGTSLPEELRKNFSWDKPESTEFLMRLLSEESCRGRS